MKTWTRPPVQRCAAQTHEKKTKLRRPGGGNSINARRSRNVKKDKFEFIRTRHVVPDFGVDGIYLEEQITELATMRVEALEKKEKYRADIIGDIINILEIKLKRVRGKC